MLIGSIYSNSSLFLLDGWTVWFRVIHVIIFSSHKFSIVTLSFEFCANISRQLGLTKFRNFNTTSVTNNYNYNLVIIQFDNSYGDKTTVLYVFQIIIIFKFLDLNILFWPVEWNTKKLNDNHNSQILNHTNTFSYGFVTKKKKKRSKLKSTSVEVWI